MKISFTFFLPVLLSTSVIAMDQEFIEQAPSPLLQHQREVDIFDTPLTSSMTPKQIKEIGYSAFPYYQAFLRLEHHLLQTSKSETIKISLMKNKYQEVQDHITTLQSTIERYKQLKEKSKTYEPGANKSNDISFGITWYPEGITADGQPKSFIPMSPYQRATSYALQQSYDAHFKLPEFRIKKAAEFQQKIDENQIILSQLEEELVKINQAIQLIKAPQQSISLAELQNIILLKNTFRNIANPAIDITLEPKPGVSDEILLSIQTNNTAQIQKAILASNYLREVMAQIPAEKIWKMYQSAMQLPDGNE